MDYGDAGDEQSMMQVEPHHTSTQELERLFHQNLNLSDPLPRQQCSLPSDARAIKPAIQYSASQHYTHSAHITPALHPLQPSKQDQAARILIKYDIAPSTLLRSQLALFEEAHEDQKLRLIELWRAVPPTYARNGGQALADRLGEYQTTTVAQEERLAGLNYQGGSYSGDVRFGGNQIVGDPDQAIHVPDSHMSPPALEQTPQGAQGWPEGWAR